MVAKTKSKNYLLNMINKLKGFTIIELIVVIAIIAVLASIVMVNVTQYINKSKDSSIKANLKTLQINAAIWFSDDNKGHGSYAGFAETNDHKAPISAIVNSGGTYTHTIVSSDYCVDSTLSSHTADNPNHWCIDDTGFAGRGTCVEGIACIEETE